MIFPQSLLLKAVQSVSATDHALLLSSDTFAEIVDASLKETPDICNAVANGRFAPVSYKNHDK
jgi:hypothetical protein